MKKGLFHFVSLLEEYDGRPAIITPEQTISYRDYLAKIRAAAANLVQLGIQENAHVAIRSKNCQEYAVILPALWLLRAVAVPISIRFPAAQVNSLLERLKCQHLVLNPAAAGAVFACCFQKNNLEALVHGHSIGGETKERGDFQLNAHASVVFTSGSSGRPKAVLHTLGNHVYSALGANENLPFGRGERWLMSLPLYHVGGLAILFRAWMGGGSIVFGAPDTALVRTLQSMEITHISLVATQLLRLMKNESGRRVLRRLKAVLLGGSAMPYALIRDAVEAGIPIYTSYGSSEMASQITTTSRGASLKELLTAGKILKYREVKLAEDSEILVKGRTLFQGYRQNGALETACNADGWFATGDRGAFDADGNLNIMGRKDNMFISGGENIHPEEIEQRLACHQEVRQTIVVPVKNGEFGMRPVAFVEMRDLKPFAPEMLRQYLSLHIARFKIPDYFFPWPESIKYNGIKQDRRYFAGLAEKMLESLCGRVL